MFENILGRGNREEQLLEKTEQKKMDFTREQTNYQSNAQMDQVDLAIQDNRADLIRWQQELEPELTELILQLKGFKRAADGTWYLPSDAQPLCNDLFINDVVIPQCKPFISRGFINSNLSEDRILLMLEKTSNDIVSIMADGWDMYGISFIKNDTVCRMIKNVLTPGAFRSLEGWTKKTDSTNSRRIESFYDQAPAKKQGRLFGIGS